MPPPRGTSAVDGSWSSPDLAADHASMGRPLSTTVPALGGRNPAMRSSSVLLPAPLRPISATNSPGPTRNVTSRSTGTSPACHPTPVTFSSIVMGRRLRRAATRPWFRPLRRLAGPGTTKASLVTAWTRPARDAASGCRFPERFRSHLPGLPLLERVAHVARVDDDVGREANDGLHRDPRIVGESFVREHVHAARDGHEVASGTIRVRRRSSRSAFRRGVRR